MDEHDPARPRHRHWRWLGFDVVAVVAFVLIGRDTHNEGNAIVGVIGTLAPLAAGLVAGWVATDAARDPASIRTGLGVAAVAGVAGVAIRRLVFGDGIALPFLLVLAGFYVASMVGWRVVATRLTAARESV